VLRGVDWYSVVDWTVFLVAPLAFIVGVGAAIRDYRRREPADRRGARTKVRAMVGLPINGARYAVAGVAALLLAAFGIGLGVNLVRDLQSGAPAPVTAARGQARACVPGYSICLSPKVSDYDCAGGFGDGPRYVKGPIRVTGSDPFFLDLDGNRIGCEY
jgi:hypothetical protein